MLDAFLSPAAIAFVTSLGGPAALFVSELPELFSEHLVVSETTKALTGFFRKRFAWKKLRNIYIEAVDVTLNEESLILDETVREELLKSKDSFRDFSPFIEKYNQLCNLSFHKRKTEARAAFRQYIKEHIPNIPDNVLDALENNFSKIAFSVINNCIKKSPETFYLEAKEALERIELELDHNKEITLDIQKKLEIQAEAIQIFQDIAPEIPELKRDHEEILRRLDEIKCKIDNVENKVDGVQNTVSDIQKDVATLKSKIDIQSTLGKSREYSDLQNELTELEEVYESLPENKVELRLKQSKKIKNLKDTIQAFENDVIHLAETFSTIKINTKRLHQAQEAFEAGDFKRTAEILNACDLKSDQERLLARKEENQKLQEILNKQLYNNSKEFLVKAQATVLDFSNPHRINDTKDYFEQSLKSYCSFENLFAYACFLKLNNQFSDSLTAYSRILTEFKNDLSIEDRALTLHNLADLHQITDKNMDAEAEYTESLKIRRDLAKDNPTVYLSDVAGTLNNLAILHKKIDKNMDAEAEYTESLKIRRDLAKDNPTVYLSDVAMTLNNLACLHDKTNKNMEAEAEYSKTLKIYRDLAKDNPTVYLSDVAMTLNNLACLHYKTDKNMEAEAEYSKTLKIYRDLAKDNPTVYLSYVAKTLNNLACLHYKTDKNMDAEAEYTESHKIRRDLAKDNPTVYLSDVAGTLNNLAILHKKIDKNMDAEAEYTESLKIRRDLAKDNPTVYLSDVAMTLFNLACLHDKTNKNMDAEAEYTESLKIQRDLAKDNPTVYLSDVAMALNNLAELHQKIGKLELAKDESDEAFKILASINIIANK
jgi:archaellum component FlaC